MKKRFLCLIMCVLVCIPPMTVNVFADSATNNTCFIASVECPTEYVEYAEENVSRFILSEYSSLAYGKIDIGSPFAFANAGADVFYFPIISDGEIKLLLRIYPDGDSFSAAISAFLADEIEELAPMTSENTPMYLNRVDTAIIAKIGEESFELYRYPDYMSVAENQFTEAEALADELLITDVKESSEIEINLGQARDVSKYINLSITETQGSTNWCTAYCLAAIIRTLTPYKNMTARGAMITIFGDAPNPSTAFPWTSDNGASISRVSNSVGLYPTVLTTTVSNGTLINNLNDNLPCLVAMESGSALHSVVLRGYSSQNTWSIWNPWFNYYESYSMDGTYVPTGYSSSQYSFTPYMHAYNFRYYALLDEELDGDFDVESIPEMLY